MKNDVEDVDFKKNASFAGMHITLLMNEVDVLVPSHYPGIDSNSNDDSNSRRDKAEEISRSNVIEVDETVLIHGSKAMMVTDLVHTTEVSTFLTITTMMAVNRR